MKIKNSADNILILGGGPAGMSCAVELSNEGKNSTIIEKDRQVGGLAKTLVFGDFKTDIGPHRFFSKNQYLYDFIEDLLGEQWIKVDRHTRFFIDNKFFTYPVDLPEALRKVGPYKAFRMLSDYMYEKAKSKIRKPKIKSFEDYVVTNFGRTLAEFNMINYTEKIWGVSCKKLSSLQGEQRLKGLSVTEILKDYASRKLHVGGSSNAKSLVDQFYYPDTGTGLIYEAMKERVVKEGSQVFLNSSSKEIKVSKNKIISVVVDENGKEVTYNPNFVVSSIPITDLVRSITPQAPGNVLNALSKLQYRSQVYLFLTLNKASLSNDNWIYFHEKNIPFGRIYEPRNNSVKMSPKGKTSIFIEFFCFEGDDVWNMSKDELVDLSVPVFKKIGFFGRRDIINSYKLSNRNVYPIYDLDFNKNLNIVKKYLDSIENLQYIGRPGRFKYNNQDHSLEMGILAARTIIDHKKYDIESVGSEVEYFEKGYIKDKKL